MSDNLEHVDFPFESARRITNEEVTAAKLAVEEQFGIEPGKRDRPPKPGDSELKLSIPVPGGFADDQE